MDLGGGGGGGASDVRIGAAVLANRFFVAHGGGGGSYGGGTRPSHSGGVAGGVSGDAGTNGAAGTAAAAPTVAGGGGGGIAGGAGGQPAAVPGTDQPCAVGVAGTTERGAAPVNDFGGRERRRRGRLQRRRQRRDRRRRVLQQPQRRFRRRWRRHGDGQVLLCVVSLGSLPDGRTEPRPTCNPSCPHERAFVISHIRTPRRVDRSDAEVGVAELAPHVQQADALMCHLDGMGVTQLVRREAASYSDAGGDATQLRGPTTAA